MRPIVFFSDVDVPQRGGKVTIKKKPVGKARRIAGTWYITLDNPEDFAFPSVELDGSLYTSYSLKQAKADLAKFYRPDLKK